MSDSEEEILILLDFDQPVPPCTDGTCYKVIGLDTNVPVVQYKKQVFTGEWLDWVGTKVLLGEKKAPEALDPAFSPETPKQYEYCYKTSKVLRLNPHVLKPKDVDASEGGGNLSDGMSEESSDGLEETSNITQEEDACTSHVDVNVKEEAQENKS